MRRDERRKSLFMALGEELTAGIRAAADPENAASPPLARQKAPRSSSWQAPGEETPIPGEIANQFLRGLAAAWRPLGKYPVHMVKPTCNLTSSTPSLCRRNFPDTL